MPSNFLRTGSLVLALLGSTALSAGNAVAQQAAPAAEPQQQQQQEKAQQTPSGKMGADEPSSHAPEPEAGGQFGVRQRRLGGSRCAGKYRYRTGKVFREERRRRQAQHRCLHIQAADRRAARCDLCRAQGAARRAGLQRRHRRRAAIIGRVASDAGRRRRPRAQTKDYRYAVADNRVLLVSPVARYVVGVFMDDVQAPKATEGRRTP